jgi:predicted amidohydrolase YtcJ
MSANDDTLTGVPDGDRGGFAHPAWQLVTARRIHVRSGPPAQAMVMWGDRVVATGPAADLADRFPITERVDLDGFVIPGLNDAHAHPTMTAENLLHVNCSPEIADSEQRLVELLRAEAATLPAGRWVRGSRYDESKTTGGRIVDRWFLDAVVPDRPVLLTHVAAHWGVLNSAGLTAAGLNDDTPDPPGGALGRDGAGKLNGVVFEQALFDLSYPALSRGPTVLPESDHEARLRSLGRALQMFHAAGLTSMTDALCGPEDVRLLVDARRRGELTMRVGMLVAYPHYDHIRSLGLLDGFGDHQLRLLGVKAFVDGACAGGNCLVDEPFEGTDDHGMQTLDTEALEQLVARIAGDGVVIGVHANGDRAIRMLLSAHEKARAAGAPALRHRIEHCSLIDADIVARMRALGLVAVPFGSYARFHGDKLVGYYGHERLERMFAHRTLLDAGVPVAGSSDYPCGPYEPLAGIGSCVERISLDGTVIGPSQRISVEEALAVYTYGSAYASGEENLKGALAPGMLADFVELDHDPFAIEAAEIVDLKVRSTWVGGRPVFAAA